MNEQFIYSKERVAIAALFALKSTSTSIPSFHEIQILSKFAIHCINNYADVIFNIDVENEDESL